jgi:hypothetical protein
MAKRLIEPGQDKPDMAGQTGQTGHCPLPLTRTDRTTPLGVSCLSGLGGCPVSAKREDGSRGMRP